MCECVRLGWGRERCMAGEREVEFHSVLGTPPVPLSSLPLPLRKHHQLLGTQLLLPLGKAEKGPVARFKAEL